WTLLEADSPLVIELIETVQNNLILSLAGLRNGSAKLALLYFARHSGHDLEPCVNDRLRDRIVSIALSQHKVKLAAELQGIASDPKLPTARAEAILVLLGHLKLDGFDEVIRSLWNLNKQLLLAEAIWAAARCPVANAADLLAPMLDCLAAMPQRKRPEENPSD